MYEDLFEDFHYASEGEWDQAGAFEVGAANPDRAWICSDRDVWYANPYYHGPKVPHPEDDHAHEEIVVRYAEEGLPDLNSADATHAALRAGANYSDDEIPF